MTAMLFFRFDFLPEGFDEEGDIVWGSGEHVEGGFALAGALGFAEVLEGGAAGDARKEAGEGVARGAGGQGGGPGRFAESFAIGLPVVSGGLEEARAMRHEVVRFTQEMREGEAEIEGGVAPVDDFVIEEDEAALVDEDVFRAVIAVDEGVTRGAGFGDEGVEEGGGIGRVRGAVGVVGLEAEGFEKGAVFKEGGELGRALVGAAMDAGEEAGELLEVRVFDLAAQEEGLPIFVWLWDGLHGQEIVRFVFEKEGRNVTSVT
jgi:hypothetical protein